jgi:hypothetical protein
MGDNGKLKVKEASYVTSKILSFKRRGRVIPFSEFPDPSMNQEDKAVPTDRKVCTAMIWNNSEFVESYHSFNQIILIIEITIHEKLINFLCFIL